MSLLPHAVLAASDFLSLATRAKTSALVMGPALGAGVVAFKHVSMPAGMGGGAARGLGIAPELAQPVSVSASEALTSSIFEAIL